MKILVTGADGFIGSHLVEKLYSQGHEIRALSQYNSFNNWGWLEDIPCQENIEIISGDIRDPFFCNEICRDIEVVFHLAALIAIPYSYIAPSSYVETNINGTLNLCQAAMNNGVNRFIHTSTSEVYGSAKYVPIDESHPLQPQSPYSASKIGADMMAMSYFHAFELPVIIARPFNTFGPRQSSRAVIPTIISQIANNSTELKLGDMKPTREFNYVSDTCEGFIALSKAEDIFGETINIGSNREISIEDLANLIKKLMGSDIKIVQEDQRKRPKGSEVMRLKCDNSKIISLTDFEAQTGLDNGLIKTIEWFKNPNNLAKYKTGIYNI